MTQQTALQKLLQWVRATLPMNLDYPQMIEKKIESLLANEKEQIINAHTNGQAEFDTEAFRQKVVDNAEQYYNETYGQSKVKLP